MTSTLLSGLRTYVFYFVGFWCPLWQEAHINVVLLGYFMNNAFIGLFARLKSNGPYLLSKPLFVSFTKNPPQKHVFISKWGTGSFSLCVKIWHMAKIFLLVKTYFYCVYLLFLSSVFLFGGYGDRVTGYPVNRY